jgi:hypothetical protein
MTMESSEVLSAFVDGEPVDAGALVAALSQPGARETLIDFVRLRAELVDEERPSGAFVRRMRKGLGGTRHDGVRLLLRIAAAIVVGVLATIGALDLVRASRPVQRPDDPPIVTRVIRFEPGVDWKPIEGR